MKILNFSVLLLLIICLSACGRFSRDSEAVYMKSKEVETLQVPEDLNRPRTDTTLIISGDNLPPPAQSDGDGELPPRVVAEHSDTYGSALNYDARGSYLVVKDTVDSVQRRLGLSIERSGMALLQNDEGSKTIRFRYEQAEARKKGFFRRMAFWKGDPDNHSGEYVASLVPDGDNSRVYLSRADGQPASEDSLEVIIGIIAERLG